MLPFSGGDMGYRNGITVLSAIAMAALMAAVPGRSQTASKPLIAKADDWTALLDRSHGWTGGDGIFAIPLSGYEGPDHAGTGKTLFVFSDTFIGDVDPITNARKNTVMVNNSLAILDGNKPDSSKMRFIWGRDDKGLAASAFIPNTPSTVGTQSWYWLQDGFCHKGVVYDLPLIVQRDSTAAAGWQFKETGIGLIRIPLGADGEPDMAKATQKDTPLYHKGAKTVYFGCGIFANTREAGAPDPDDSVYVYGRNELYVARVHVDEFEDFSKWRYWDGKGWNMDISKSASLGLGGPEMSVMAVTEGSLKGKYVLVSSMVGPDLFMRVGDGPAGPFGNALNIYKAPEWDTSVPVYTYNAKAHPSLSSNGDWIVTYNVNTSNWTANLANADLYHPRFLRVRFDPASAIGLPARGKSGWRASGTELLTGASRSGYRLDGRFAPQGRPIQGVLAIRENSDNVSEKSREESREESREKNGDKENPGPVSP
ncbi:MAG: type protein [Fibrobacteres bacterium]|nr:type protein [Fibrobacterota bacterium]